MGAVKMITERRRCAVPWNQEASAVACSPPITSLFLLHTHTRAHHIPLTRFVCLKKRSGKLIHKISSVQSLSHVPLFATPWTAARQASLSCTISQGFFKLMSIASVMPSNHHHLILCRPLLLSPSIFHRIRVFSNESTLHIRWPKYWRFSFSLSPSNVYSGLISFRMD